MELLVPEDPPGGPGVVERTDAIDDLSGAVGAIAAPHAVQRRLAAIELQEPSVGNTGRTLTAQSDAVELYAEVDGLGVASTAEKPARNAMIRLPLYDTKWHARPIPVIVGRADAGGKALSPDAVTIEVAPGAMPSGEG